MNAYLDTSAILKLVVVEPGTATVATAWQGANLLVTGRLMYAEARAGLASAGRRRRVTARDLPQARRELERLWRDLDVWEAVQPIVRQAGDLAERHALRGYDAVHLATAVAAGVDVLVTADVDLLRVAPACGLSIVDARS